MDGFNDRIRQLLVLFLLILLVYLVIQELYIFLPGLLGALTIYILSRGQYFQLVYNRKWKKGGSAGLFIIYYLLLLGIPIFLSITLISPKINAFLENPDAMLEAAKKSIMTRVASPSIRATLAPCFAAIRDERTPAEPPPITM